MNAYFQEVQKAKKANKQSFQYKGHTYVKHTLKTGLVTYKKK